MADPKDPDPNAEDPNDPDPSLVVDLGADKPGKGAKPPVNKEKQKTTKPEKKVVIKEDKEKQKKKKKRKMDEDGEYLKPPCNPRLEELSKPTIKLLSSTYTVFHDTLPKDRIEAIGMTLQEEMAMPTEEAAQKLGKMRKTLSKKKQDQGDYLQAKRNVKDLTKKQQKFLMRRAIKELLKTAMYDAYFNPKQIIMSERLRKLSNLIVKDICDIMSMKVPDRKENGRRAKFLFSVGDYFAFGIENLYFEIQVKNMANYEEIKRQETEKKEKTAQTA